MKKILAVYLLCATLLAGCATQLKPAASTPAQTPPTVSNEAQVPAPQEDVITQVSLFAVGDNLIHDVLYKQAGARTGGSGYDFLPLYDGVKERIAAADIAFINQETPVAQSFPPATYPMFNAPTEMADNLKTVGFDVINLANNHMLDQGVTGLEETMALLRAKEGLTMIGAYDAAPDYDSATVLTKNDISFGFVGFTQFTNGLRTPDDKADMLVYTDEIETVQRQIEAAKKAADVVVVSVHWGEEGTTRTTQYQQQLAQTFADWGVDIVLGTHPHVIQPVEYLQGADGQKTLVLYSLGNFVSAQASPANMVGGMASIQIEKNQTTGEVSIAEPKMDFAITHYDSGFANLRLVALEDYTPELAARHGVAGMSGQAFTLDYIDGYIKQTIDGRFLA